MTSSCRELSIDLETYSIYDVKHVGAYKYAENCEILLFGYAYGNDPVTVIDLTKGELIPRDIIQDLLGSSVRKWAYNAMFERVVLSVWLRRRGLFFHDYLPADSWYCTMAYGAYLGLPIGLGMLTKILFPNDQDKQKMAEGKSLIRYFCMPCEMSVANGFRLRNDYRNSPEKWDKFVEYNGQDVDVERASRRVMERVKEFPESEHRNYVIDQRINDRGVGVDTQLISNAIEWNDRLEEEYLFRMQEITGLANPKAPAQFLAWLRGYGLDIDSVAKDSLNALVDSGELLEADPCILEAIELKKLLGKTSIKKYHAANITHRADSRIGGLLQFYGASRTGRFAGRLVQVQNLAKNNIRAIKGCRSMLHDGEFDSLRELYPNPTSILSQLIRTMFIPRKKNEFLIADFHAIEAVLSAWLSGEEWRLEVFRGAGMIYEASAAQMFHVPADSIKTVDGKKGENYALRAKGKIAELALGYGGGVNALLAMGALSMGLTEEELPDIVTKWRIVSPKIKDFWHILELACRKTIKHHTIEYLPKNIVVFYESGFMFIKLPSGRLLSYFKPQLVTKSTKFGMREEITYDGLDQEHNRWTRIHTWGGKLFENVIQAIARDLLCYALDNLEQHGYPVVMHVHDEAIADVPRDTKTVDDMCRIMAIMPEWGKDIPLEADGFKSDFYMKD